MNEYDSNRIFGVGLIKNIPYYNKYRIYGEQVESFEDYNRYVYVGKHHIKREDMTEEEKVLSLSTPGYHMAAE